MILLQALNGSAIGRRFEANKFPITIGRASDCAVVLSEAGVFDRHFEIQFSPEGFTLQASPHAVVTVNGDRTESALLRNGDVISAGYSKIQFWLGAMKQRGLALREIFTWLMIFSVIAAQIYLFAKLLALAP
jgi:pSer/pThr/pTyr-binding forkhead associated (FHA) protein